MSTTESISGHIHCDRDVRRQYAVGSMFAGIGGICRAFKDAGAEIVWANEIDHNACETYRKNFGSGYLVEGDIMKIDSAGIPKLDILTAGFPCQAFSIAGYRKGFKDPRGALFFEIVRLIDDKEPRVVFIENVKNLVKHDNGNTFKNIRQCLEESGYIVDYRVFNTKDYGNLPQNRERVYIVAFRDRKDYDHFAFPGPVLLDADIHSIIRTDRKENSCYYYGESFSHYRELKDAVKNRDTVYQWRRIYVRENMSGVCPTLTANMGMGGHNVPLIIDDFGIRKLTPEECLEFQGFPQEFSFADVSRACKYKQAGNSVSVPVVRRIAENIIAAMNKTDGC
ncbi:MAG: DNA cytosine methyltransferase [Candidatus Methanogranum gryphiswaldense]|nr:MAG: DNA cytosine methyltransferase [Candidatus Methanogranum sp. U3.2.1]